MPEPKPQEPNAHQEGENNGEFGWKLFQYQVMNNVATENILISPLCMEMVFHLAANGAAGTTYAEMASSLAISDLESRNQSFRRLIEQAQKSNVSEFGLSNGLMYDPERVSMNKIYTETLSKYYDAQIKSLPFSVATSVSKINEWVKEKTGNRIEKIIEEISDDEVAFLISCLYFKSDWKKPFDPEMTKSGVFTLANGNSKDVPYMFQDNQFRVHTDENWVYTELPYANERYCMALVMPASEQILDSRKWISSLNIATLKTLAENAQQERVYLNVPKFELRYDAEMSASVKEAGIKEAFIAGKADFSEMGEAGKRMFISRVLHKTFLLVDEKGSEGAAVGSLGIGITSMPPVYRYDRAFVAILMDKSSGHILFAAALNSL